MKTTRRSSAAALLVTLAATLAGCTSQPSADGPGPESSPTSSATSPAAPATRLALSELVVSPAGVGPLLVGQPVADEPEESAVVTWDPTGCITAGVPAVEGEPWSGYWRSAYEDAGNPDDRTFTVVTKDGVEDGPIARVIVYGDELATEEGVRVGSTVDEVLAAYPDAVVQPGPAVSRLYVVEGATGSLSVEVAIDSPELPGYWDAAQIDTVLWMVVFDASDEVTAAAASDTIGPCPV